MSAGGHGRQQGGGRDRTGEGVVEHAAQALSAANAIEVPARSG
ncbi:hypothetical protein ACFV7R_42525 [Streptomyces sp. NPDC059866]